MSRNLEKEYIKGFVRRIVRDENYYPTDKVVRKYGLTLDFVNKIRKIAGYNEIPSKKRKLYEIYTNLVDYVKEHKVAEKLRDDQKRIAIYENIIKNREMLDNTTERINDLKKKTNVHVDKIDFENMTIDDVSAIMKELKLKDNTVKIYKEKLNTLYSYLIGEEYDANYYRFMAMFKEIEAENLYDAILQLVRETTGGNNPSTLNSYIKPLNWIVNNLPGINNYLGQEKIKKWKSIFKENKENELQLASDKMNEKIDSFETMIKKVEKANGKDNIVYLLLKLFEIKPMRNNDYKLMIYKTDDKNLDDDKNYLIITRGNNVKLVFDFFKQSNKKGTIVHSEVNKTIVDLVKKLKLQPNTKIFSTAIDSKLKDTFKKSKVVTGNSGPFNYLRKSIQGDKKYKELEHSALTKIYYGRKLK